jgi:hypothetical protein
MLDKMNCSISWQNSLLAGLGKNSFCKFLVDKFGIQAGVTCKKLNGPEKSGAQWSVRWTPYLSATANNSGLVLVPISVVGINLGDGWWNATITDDALWRDQRPLSPLVEERRPGYWWEVMWTGLTNRDITPWCERKKIAVAGCSFA